MLVTINEAESVITWDFDVIRGDLTFTVFKHKRPKEASSGSLTSIGSNSSALSASGAGIIAGVDAVVVEKPRHCQDGESIQVCDTLFCTFTASHLIVSIHRNKDLFSFQ